MEGHLRTICWSLLLIIQCALSLRDIELSVPEAVSIGGTAILGCKWTLDSGETLYTVKWYHGAQEFFRFIPKEHPNTRVFPRPAITVDIARSGAEQVVLRGARRSYSGRYRCEVSADAPYFHTVYKSSFMHVVELPEYPPVILSEKSWYSTGDLLSVNCTSSPAEPPANLTWYLNSEEVKGLPLNMATPATTTMKPSQQLEDTNTIIFSPWNIPETASRQSRNVITNDIEPTNKRNASVLEGRSTTQTVIPETSRKIQAGSMLVFRVKGEHFIKGRMNLTCVANIFREYSAKAELVIEEERPHLAPVMGNLDTSLGTMLYTRLPRLMFYLYSGLYVSRSVLCC